MAEVDLAVVGPLVHREIDDPGELELVFVDQLQLAPDLGPRAPGDSLEVRGLAAQEERGIPLAQAKLGADRFGLFRPQRLGDRTGGFGGAPLVLAPEDIPHPRQPLPLRERVHPVRELARPACGRGDRADLGPVLLQQLGEDAEAGAAEMVAHVLHLDRVAQVGLVGAVFPQALDIGDQRPVGIDAAAAAELLEQALDHRLDGGEHVPLFHERHLDVELVEVGGRTVGARVLVAEAGRDLEIAVEARDHDKLLELLGRLRQRVELARMQPRRHEEVARPFGRGRGDDRGLELGKARIPHAVADRPDHLRPQHDVVVQAVAPQVEEAIGEARFLGVVLVAEHRQRQLVRGAEHLDRGRIDLDLARRQLRVHEARVAQLHPAVDADHRLGPQPFQRREGGRVAVGDHLGDAVVVAQVDEQDAAVIADAMHPARQADLVARVLGSQLAASMRAIGVHRASFPASAGASLSGRAYTGLKA